MSRRHPIWVYWLVPCYTCYLNKSLVYQQVLESRTAKYFTKIWLNRWLWYAIMDHISKEGKVKNVYSLAFILSVRPLSLLALIFMMMVLLYGCGKLPSWKWVEMDVKVHLLRSLIVVMNCCKLYSFFPIWTIIMTGQLDWNTGLTLFISFHHMNSSQPDACANWDCMLTGCYVRNINCCE